MGQLIKITGRWMIPLALLAALMLAAGCSKTATAVSSAATLEYKGALSTSYDGALDVTSQFALGTLKLEGTTNAVTEEQATKLLPLWQALQGGVAQTGAEKSAVIRQIEAAMTQPQVAAIAEMQLTQEAIQTWAQERVRACPDPAAPDRERHSPVTLRQERRSPVARGSCQETWLPGRRSLARCPTRSGPRPWPNSAVSEGNRALALRAPDLAAPCPAAPGAAPPAPADRPS